MCLNTQVYMYIHIHIYLNAEGQVSSDVIQVMLQEVDHPLIKRIIFTLHIGIVDGFTQYVFIERSCEVTIQEFVVVDGFGNHSSDESEIVEVVGVNVGAGVRLVSHSVSRGRCEQGIVGVKHVSCDDDVEFSQEPTCILTFLPFKLDIEVPLEIFRGPAIELSESVFKDVFSTEVDYNVLPAQPVVHHVKLVTEVTSFDVEIQYLCVVHKY